MAFNWDTKDFPIPITYAKVHLYRDAENISGLVLTSQINTLLTVRIALTLPKIYGSVDSRIDDHLRNSKEVCLSSSTGMDFMYLN